MATPPSQQTRLCELIRAADVCPVWVNKPLLSDGCIWTPRGQDHPAPQTGYVYNPSTK
jgi:hypothetical protein